MTDQENIQRLINNINELRKELGGNPLAPEKMIQTALSRMFIDLSGGDPDVTIEDWYRTCEEKGWASEPARPEHYRAISKMVREALESQYA